MGSDVASVNLAALAAVGIVGLLGPLSATAQVQPPEDFQDGPRTHRTRYMTPAIDLKEFGVDSNVFNTTDQPGVGFCGHCHAAGCSVDSCRPALIWQANTSGDFVYFATHASERSINPRSAHGRRCRSDSRSSTKGRTKIRGSARTSRSMRGRVARKRAPAPASAPT